MPTRKSIVKRKSNTNRTNPSSKIFPILTPFTPCPDCVFKKDYASLQYQHQKANRELRKLKETNDDYYQRLKLNWILLQSWLVTHVGEKDCECGRCLETRKVVGRWWKFQNFSFFYATSQLLWQLCTTRSGMSGRIAESFVTWKSFLHR